MANKKLLCKDDQKDMLLLFCEMVGIYYEMMMKEAQVQCYTFTIFHLEMAKQSKEYTLNQRKLCSTKYISDHSVALLLKEVQLNTCSS